MANSKEYLKDAIMLFIIGLAIMCSLLMFMFGYWLLTVKVGL